jgi:hypothetical protein
MLLQYFRQLYSLDTLDTRFIIPATSPPKEALEEAQLDSKGTLSIQDERLNDRKMAENASPSKWRTPEFSFYFVVIAICLPLMVKCVYDVSQGQFKSYINSTQSIVDLCKRFASKLFQVLSRTVRWLDTRP